MDKMKFLLDLSNLGDDQKANDENFKAMMQHDSFINAVYDHVNGINDSETGGATTVQPVDFRNLETPPEVIYFKPAQNLDIPEEKQAKKFGGCVPSTYSFDDTVGDEEIHFGYDKKAHMYTYTHTHRA